MQNILLRSTNFKNKKHTIVIHSLIAMGLMLSASGILAEQKEAQRIIALSPHSVELLFALGAGERIIATTEHADYPKAALNIERIGGFHGLQIERIVELRPDLIVAWQGGNRAQDLDKLESLGLNVYRSETKTLFGIVDELNALAKSTGTQSKARALEVEFREAFTELAQQYQSKSSVSFFYQLWQQPLRTMASGSWINEIFETCNGQNVVDSNSGLSDYPQINLESVILEAPQAIFIPSDHGSYSQAGGLWQKWPQIPAVKQNNIFFIDGDLLHRFSLRVMDGAKEVCNKLDEVRQKSRQL
ncbi:ABC transporter, periplasmic substrate-binding protein, putative [Oceanobacter sp. RED65]|uniref:ABC transporter, periplasmic substrate-binding protein, putative n=2 Tax=Bermanella marisrubri TaxID=207949 RepID=Q1MY46_9GAMM|nr:ABC transporter, periplasmic substrate-binding protein, putative [Oceanobacter sp. RED65] [Bermanella marisrubri]